MSGVIAFRDQQLLLDAYRLFDAALALRQIEWVMNSVFRTVTRVWLWRNLYDNAESGLRNMMSMAYDIPLATTKIARVQGTTVPN